MRKSELKALVKELFSEMVKENDQSDDTKPLQRKKASGGLETYGYTCGNCGGTWKTYQDPQHAKHCRHAKTNENDNSGKEILHGEKEPADEGFGWGDPKKIAKDPLHIPGERWRIKFKEGVENKCRCGGVLRYSSDIASPGSGQYWQCPKCKKSYVKMGSNLIDPENINRKEPPPWELDPSDVMEGKIKNSDLQRIVNECVGEVINEYSEDEEINYIKTILKMAQKGMASKSIGLFPNIIQICKLLIKMHKEDPQPKQEVPVKGKFDPAVNEKYIRGHEQHEDAEVALISQIRSLAQVAKMSGSTWKSTDWTKWIQAIEKISDRLLKMHTAPKEAPKLGLKHDIPLEEGNGKYSVKPPVRKPETNEWVVKWYINGKYDENGTCYTDDKNDANDTYRAMSQRAATLNKK